MQVSACCSPDKDVLDTKTFAPRDRRNPIDYTDIHLKLAAALMSSAANSIYLNKNGEMIGEGPILKSRAFACGLAYK